MRLEIVLGQVLYNCSFTLHCKQAKVFFHFDWLLSFLKSTPPPHWPSGYGIRLDGKRSRVRIPLAPGMFLGSSHTSDLKIGTPVATLPGACITGSVLGLVGPVSVYFDWVRWKV